MGVQQRSECQNWRCRWIQTGTIGQVDSRPVNPRRAPAWGSGLGDTCRPTRRAPFPTLTYAASVVTLPYVVQLAEKGFVIAVRDSASL